MKKLIRLASYALSVLCLVMIWTACSKNTSTPVNTVPPFDSTAPPTKPAVTAVTLITYKAWVYDTSGIDNNKDGMIGTGDIGDPGFGPGAVILTCQRDDSYTFKADSTGTTDGGTNKCVVGEAQTTPFTWSFNKDTTILTASINSVLESGMTIIKLDSTQLSVYKDSVIFGTSYRYLVKLKH